MPINQFGFSVYPGAGEQPVVFLHGFLGSRLDWEPACDALRGQFRVFPFDLPGHGDTAISNDTSFESAAQDLVSFLDSANIRKPHLVGYSMGGRIALYLTVRCGEKFGDVVITSASPGIEDDNERADRRLRDDALAERLSSEPLARFVEGWYRQPLFASLQKYPDLLRQLMSRRTENNPQSLATALRVFSPGRQPSLWAELKGIRNRVLLVAGGLDAKYVAVSRVMARHIATAQEAIIPEAGHALHLEQPGPYIAALRAFLRPA